MKYKSINDIFRARIFLVILALTMLIAVIAERAGAKSLYVITDIGSNPVPIQAYDIGINGALTFQAERTIPNIGYGAVGLAIDSDSGYLFVTYEESQDIYLIDGTTMTTAGSVTAPNALNLAGVVYDHEKELLYCVDRETSWLYVYRWDPVNIRLEEADNSPVNLRRATAYGITLDEVDDVLYVANGTKEIYAYNTSNWTLVRTITVSRKVINVAIEVKSRFLYSGGGFINNYYLIQNNLVTGAEKEVQVEPDAGVMGLKVDSDTGLVYMTTGRNGLPGGDNILIYDKSLQQVGKIPSIGRSPTGLAIPGKDIGYNPLNLKKDVTEGATENDLGVFEALGAGSQITYTISFDNLDNDFDVTDLIIFDTLPKEVSFVSADDDKNFGQYDSLAHTYTWIYPVLLQGAARSLDLTVQINEDIAPGTNFTNFVTISSSGLPPTTKSIEVQTTCNPLYIRKYIEGVSADQVMMVDPNDNIIYKIHFNNNNNDFTVTNVTIVDILPQELSFVRADYNQFLGSYDAETHTYTWSYPPMESGNSTNVELIAKVKPEVVPGTTITNFVMIDSDETPVATSSVDAVTSGVVNRLNLSKSVIGTVGDVIKVGLNEQVTYCLCFDGNDINQTVTNVSLIDFLPKEVSFIKADGDEIIGHYDNMTHSYTWRYPFISPGQVVRLELTVRVNQNVELGTTITNLATVDADETPSSTTSIDIITDEGGWQVDSVEIIPSTLRREGTLSGIIAVLMLPEGIGKDEIGNVPITLHPGDIKARQQIVKEADGRIKIIAVFDKAEVMKAIPGYGQYSLELVGKYTSGQSFYGDATITITRFAGN